MNAVRNERVKLFANLFNALAVALITIGIIGPIIAAAYGTLIIDTGGWWFLIGVVWILGAIALHSIGSIALGSLRQP